MGNQPYPSVATYISIVQSNTLPTSIRIRHAFTYRTDSTKAYLISIPITAFVETPRIEHYNSNANEQRSRLFPDDNSISFSSSMRLVVKVKMADVWMRSIGTPPAHKDAANVRSLLDAWRKNIEQDAVHL
ncbi:hypothetical protein LZ30DRAFT_569108, partial [Colletotrichum cereale]